LNTREIVSMESEIQQAIEDHAEETTTLAGEKVQVLYEERAITVAGLYGLSLGEVFKQALSQDIVPYRYIRNQGIISIKDQLKLAVSRVAVVGAGGLGGNVIILLARTGIGHLVVIDADKFDETNLNRQALCVRENIGRPKAAEAVEKVKEINPAVEVIAHVGRLTSENAGEILRDVDVIVDALDNVLDRFVLERTAKELSVPMVHAGIAGFEGQLMSIFPQDPGLELVYGDPEKWQRPKRTPEVVLGVPAVTASLLATLQAMEVLKILLGKGEAMRNKILRPDLETGEFHHIVFA